MSTIFDFSSLFLQGEDAILSDQVTLMVVPFCDTKDIFHLFMRFGFHMLICLLIIHFCYYQTKRNRNYYTSFVLFASGMFLLYSLLESITLQIGVTVGLFAIWGVIRYRTETVPVKEMTYLFIIIMVSVINGLYFTISYVELLIANLALILILYRYEHRRTIPKINSKLIPYERIELIAPERRNELIKDIKQRTELEITGVEICHFDFLRDIAFIKIYYQSDCNESSDVGATTKVKPE